MSTWKSVWHHQHSGNYKLKPQLMLHTPKWSLERRQTIQDWKEIVPCMPDGRVLSGKIRIFMKLNILLSWRSSYTRDENTFPKSPSKNTYSRLLYSQQSHISEGSPLAQWEDASDRQLCPGHISEILSQIIHNNNQAFHQNKEWFQNLSDFPHQRKWFLCSVFDQTVSDVMTGHKTK